MIRIAPLLILLTAQAVPAATVAASQEYVCLSRQQQKAAIANGQAVTLGQAIRSARGSLRGRGGREVVKARLCRGPDGLVYRLTLLARDGKVTHTTVDAGSGKVVEAR